MTIATFIGILLMGIALGVGGLYLISRPKKKSKPAKKKASAWITRHQLEVLEAISLPGRAGIRLWRTNLSLATIRSLAKRGFVDTAKNGRVVITNAGKRRLNEPWPAQQPTGDQSDANRSDDVGETESIDSGASEGLSPLTGEGE